MDGRRVIAAGLLDRRDSIPGNWTGSPSPSPAEPATHPLAPAQHGPPYGMTTAIVGGLPTIQTDIPIAAVLLALFVVSAAAHMTILQLNKRAGFKFLFSGMLFVLSVLRTVALSMRIVWATHPHEADLAISSGILTQTGSVLVFVINLFLAQRIVRGYHPRFGWHPFTNAVFIFLVACVVASLIMAITVTVQTVLTLDADIRYIDRIVQLFAGTYMAVLAFVPIPIVILAAIIPRKSHIERFGAGRWRTKVRLLLFAAAMATLGAAFRIYTGYATRPMSDPGWYHSRACYYCFNFVTDLLVSATYLFSRFDRRFIVPNGAKGPGDYAKGTRSCMPPSFTSSSGDHIVDDEKRGGVDPEKLSQSNSNSNSSSPSKADGEGGKSREKSPVSTPKNEEGTGKGDGERSQGNLDRNVDEDADADDEKEEEKKVLTKKDKGKAIAITPSPSDDEEEENLFSHTLAPLPDGETASQTYGSGGEWNGVPWPFRASWNYPRIFGPAAASTSRPTPGNESGEHSRSNSGDSTHVASSSNNSIINSINNNNNDEREASTSKSSFWGGETSSTCIPEPDAVLFRSATHHHHPQHNTDPYLHHQSPSLRHSHSHSHSHNSHHPRHRRHHSHSNSPINNNASNELSLRLHELQHSQSYVFGQALTSNDEIRLAEASWDEPGPSWRGGDRDRDRDRDGDGPSSDENSTVIAVWPFTSEGHGDDPVTQRQGSSGGIDTNDNNIRHGSNTDANNNTDNDINTGDNNNSEGNTNTAESSSTKRTLPARASSGAIGRSKSCNIAADKRSPGLGLGWGWI